MITYHATTTKLVPKIRKEGLRPMQTSNWVTRGSKERLGDGAIHSFESHKDALRWAGKMDWEFNKDIGSGKISVLTLDSPHDWTVDHNDPLSQGGSEGKWLKIMSGVHPDHIVDATPFTREHARSLVAKRTESMDDIDLLVDSFTSSGELVLEARDPHETLRGLWKLANHPSSKDTPEGLHADDTARRHAANLGIDYDKFHREMEASRHSFTPKRARPSSAPPKKEEPREYSRPASRPSNPGPHPFDQVMSGHMKVAGLNVHPTATHGNESNAALGTFNDAHVKIKKFPANWHSVEMGWGTPMMAKTPNRAFSSSEGMATAFIERGGDPHLHATGVVPGSGIPVIDHETGQSFMHPNVPQHLKDRAMHARVGQTYIPFNHPHEILNYLHSQKAPTKSDWVKPDNSFHTWDHSEYDQQRDDLLSKRSDAIRMPASTDSSRLSHRIYKPDATSSRYAAPGHTPAPGFTPFQDNPHSYSGYSDFGHHMYSAEHPWGETIYGTTMAHQTGPNDPGHETHFVSNSISNPRESSNEFEYEINDVDHHRTGFPTLNAARDHAAKLHHFMTHYEVPEGEREYDFHTMAKEAASKFGMEESMKDAIEALIDEHIVKSGKGYRLLSHSGKNLGTSSTRGGAEKREREVEYFKHKNESISPGYLPRPSASNNNHVPNGILQPDHTSAESPTAALSLQTLHRRLGLALPELHALVTSTVTDERTALSMLFNELHTAHCDIGNVLSYTNTIPDIQMAQLRDHYAMVISQMLGALDPYRGPNPSVTHIGPYQLGGPLHDSLREDGQQVRVSMPHHPYFGEQGRIIREQSPHFYAIEFPTRPGKIEYFAEEQLERV